MARSAILLAFATLLAAETPIIPNGAPPDYKFDGRVEEWAGADPTFTLTAADGRHGVVWVRQVAEGLLIAGKVDGATDHVDVWLAPAEPPELPPYGWRNQFGGEEFESSKACDDPEATGAIGDKPKCHAWFERMDVHRSRLLSTFTRHYQMTAQRVSETVATPAYADMAAALGRDFGAIRKDAMKPLQPKGAPVFRQEAGGFESMIPWEAFPPMGALDLKEIRIAVDVFGSAGGAPPSLPLIAFEKGRQFHITSCAYPLSGFDVNENALPAQFFPTRDDAINEVLFIENESRAYLYLMPDAISPVVSTTTFSEKDLPVGGKLCGPLLAYLSNNKVTRFEKMVDLAVLNIRRERDGSYLLLRGPDQHGPGVMSAGQCGGCSHVFVELSRLTPQGELEKLYELDEIVDGMLLQDMDVQVSRDWSRIVQYAKRPLGPNETWIWIKNTFCRSGQEFKACGEQRNAPPLEPRTIPQIY